MSTYVKAKVIRLPFPEKLIEKLGVDDCWDCEDYLKDKLGERWYTNSKELYFDIECTDKAYYLDYILEKEYDACGEYGYSFLLSEEDKKKYIPLFDKIGIEYNPDDLRKVVYCYYNGCECTDYYDVSEPDFNSL